MYKRQVCIGKDTLPMNENSLQPSRGCSGRQPSAAAISKIYSGCQENEWECVAKV